MGKPSQPRDKRGRWVAKGGGIGVALAAVLGIAAATSGGGAGAAGAAGASSSAGSGVGGSVARSPSGRSGTTKGTKGSARGKARDRDTGRVVARLAQQGMRVRERGVHADTDCAAHSYGQVREFFTDHPCTALFRALLEVRDGSGNRVLVAVAWVDMPDEDQAGDLKLLMDRGGTGNITELSRERGGQRFSGQVYGSVQDGTTVVNVQAEPVGRTRAVLTLAEQAVNALT